jgi:integrase
MRNGQPYSGGVLTGAWNRTRARAGLKDANLMARDLRAKAISDGEFKQGLELKQLQQAATHSSERMTRHYARKQRTPESALRLEMPRKKASV